MTRRSLARTINALTPHAKYAARSCLWSLHTYAHSPHNSLRAQKQLTMLLEKFPDEKRNIRRSVVWMAFRRKFLRFARMTRAFTNQLVDGLHAKSTNKEQLRQLFRNADLDQSGTLTTDEVKEVLRKFGFTSNSDVMEVRVVYLYLSNQREYYYCLPPCSPLTFSLSILLYHIVWSRRRYFGVLIPTETGPCPSTSFWTSSRVTEAPKVTGSSRGRGPNLSGILKKGP